MMCYKKNCKEQAYAFVAVEREPYEGARYYLPICRKHFEEGAFQRWRKEASGNPKGYWENSIEGELLG